MTHTIRSENLEWQKGTRQFHADASTLCFLPGVPMPRRLEVVSARTGKSAFFILADYVSVSRHFNGRSHPGWFYKPEPGCSLARRAKGVYIWNT